MPAVRADALYKVFGRRPEQAVKALAAGATRDDVRDAGATPAVIDASFEVAPGEIFVVMGLSGSGKSTLIRMLNGLWRPTSGSVEIDGVNISRMRPRSLRKLRQNKVSMVFQHFALLPHRTVLDNVAYPLEVKGVPVATRRSEAATALDLVGLSGWENSLPAQLSGGMQQRVGLARAFAAGTDVLLMDEAFSALDPLIRRDMQTQLLELQNRLGKTIVFITHDLNEAMRVGDHIAVMRDGRIVQIGTAEEILTEPANDYVAQFIADVDRTRVLTASSIMEQPVATVGTGSGPRAAVKSMREQQISSIFVLARDRKLAGAVREEPAAESARRGDTSLTGLIDEDITRISPDTPVAELFLPAAESPVPLAVVDGEQRLIGVIPRVTLLAALGNAGTHRDEPLDPAPPTEPSQAEPVQPPEAPPPTDTAPAADTVSEAEPAAAGGPAPVGGPAATDGEGGTDVTA